MINNKEKAGFFSVIFSKGIVFFRMNLPAPPTGVISSKIEAMVFITKLKYQLIYQKRVVCQQTKVYFLPEKKQYLKKIVCLMQ